MPPDPAFRSTAERETWSALRAQLPAGSVLLAGLRFTTREGDREADLVIAIPDVGVAVVEVKGGSVSLEGSEWRQASGGRTRRISDPVEQARRCKYLLRSYLDTHPRWPHGRTRLGHLIALPFTDVPADFSAPDCPRWMVIGRGDMGQAAGRVCDLLAREVGAPPAPSAAQVSDLVDCLTGQLLGQVDLLARTGPAAANSEPGDLVTADQALVLDYFRHNHRIEVRGPAGAGKTWLAVEQARRLTAAGHRVALLCYSRGLAAYLRRRSEGLPREVRPAFIGTPQALGRLWNAAGGASAGARLAWLPETLVSMAEQRPGGERFDAIVVDEAEAVTSSWWPAVLAALREPEAGAVYSFLEHVHAPTAGSHQAEVALVPVDLAENLRSTRQITALLSLLTSKAGRPRGGEGAPVRFVAGPAGQVHAAADDAVRTLLAEGVDPGRLAVLTTGRRHPAHEEMERALGEHGVWAAHLDGGTASHSDVAGFKGLERSVVVLAVDDLADAAAGRKLLYDGLSRARDLLVVCGDPDLLRRVAGDQLVEALLGRSV